MLSSIDLIMGKFTQKLTIKINVVKTIKYVDFY